MPVYNGAAYLLEAIDSILAQTFPDFELLIIDDGSTDDSAKIIRSCRDSRIRFESNDMNRGLVYTLNRGIDMASGDYVAIMHADDIAHPTRLEKQVHYLETHRDIGVLGSWFEPFGGPDSGVCHYPLEHEHIAAGLLFNNQLCHPTVTFRGSFLRESGLRYRAEMFPTEDWDMWTRCASATRLGNIPLSLLRYRVHQTSVTGIMGMHLGKQSPFIERSQSIYPRLLAALGIEPTREELEIHTAIGFSQPHLTPEEVDRAERWLLRLLEKNHQTRCYRESVFKEVVGSRWSSVIMNQDNPRYRKLLRWFRSPLYIQSIWGAIRDFRVRRARVR